MTPVQQSIWNGQQVPRGMSRSVGMLVLRNLQRILPSCLYLMVLSGKGEIMALPGVRHTSPMRFLSPIGQVDRLTLAAHSRLEPSCLCLGCHKKANVCKYKSFEATIP